MVGSAIWWLARWAIADPGAPPAEPEIPVAVEAAGSPVDEPPDETSLDPTQLAFDVVLEQAESWYFEGRAEEARGWLEVLHMRVLAGEEAPWERVVEALTYLGEIQYVQGEPETARVTFRWVLEQDPEAPISPYHHPLEVVNLFDLVRKTVVAERVEEPPLPSPPPPAPAWVWLPLGVPQFAQHRRGAGAVYGGLQVALAATSVATFVHLARYNQDQEQYIGRDDRTRYVQLRRYGVQWPATFAFYGVWAVSSVDAATWHRKHATVHVGLEAGERVGVVVGGRF